MYYITQSFIFRVFTSKKQTKNNTSRVMGDDEKKNNQSEGNYVCGITIKDYTDEHPSALYPDENILIVTSLKVFTDTRGKDSARFTNALVAKRKLRLLKCNA